jgi:hypothetical protein
MIIKNGKNFRMRLFQNFSVKMKNWAQLLCAGDIAFVWFCLAGGESQGESLPKPKRNGSLYQFFPVI